MMRRLASTFDIDLRSLAALRISLALLGLWDLVVRSTSLVAHYTDAGTFPRVDLLEWFAPWHEWPICIHLVGGSTWSVALVFAVHFAALLALLLGYKSRIAAFVSWLLFASVLSRNPFLSYGGDVFLRLLLFWSFLLPVGGAWSFDRIASRRQAPTPTGEDAEAGDAGDALAPPDSPPPAMAGSSSGAWRSVASAGLLVQVCIVLFFAGAPKAGTTAWSEGVGIAFALDQEESTRALGWILRDHPALTRLLDYSVLVIEIASSILLLLPSRVLRVFVILVVWGMLAGITATMWVGIFPYLMAASLLVFVPGEVWDACARLVRSGSATSRALEAIARAAGHAVAVLSRFVAASPPLPRPWPMRRVFVEATAGLALVYVLVWNVGLWRNADYEAPRPLAWFGYVTQFRQAWGMFGEFSQTGWFVIPGRLGDGREVDLAVAGGPLPTLEETLATPLSFERPAFVPDRFHDVHWFAQYRIMRQYPDQDGHFLYYGRYLCREWNRRHADADSLRSFEILFFHREVGAHLERRPVTADYTRSVLWRHDCFR